MLERMGEARNFLSDLSEHPIVLPCEPTLLPELFSRIGPHSQSSNNTLAEIIGRSQGLAARVLSVANSACYGLESTVTSLDRAIAVLGILELRSLALLFTVAGSVPAKFLPKAFPATTLWEHQILTGQLARSMAQAIKASGHAKADELDPEALYVGGLLHDIGKLILAMRRPKDWAEITELTKKGYSFYDAEDSYWGMDHGTIGAMVLRQWNLPDLLVEMASWHHMPQLATQYKESVNILAAANRIAVEGLDKNGSIPSYILDTFYDPSLIIPTGPVIAEQLANGKAGLLAAQL